MTRWCLAVVLSAVVSFAQADVLVGRVVGVSDGDTVTVLDARQRQHTIRLGGIDAPESRQAFGQRAKLALSEIVFAREVRVEYERRDNYGRIVGKIVVDGRNVNLQMVQQGYAWWYRAYAHDQHADDRALYEVAEAAASRQRLGLWRDSSPIPPWDFRRAAAADRRSGNW